MEIKKVAVIGAGVMGAGIAIGHPLGATGARIVGKAASLLQREDKKYALATQCIGRRARYCNCFRKSLELYVLSLLNLLIESNWMMKNA